jgi:hypothetical protein
MRWARYLDGRVLNPALLHSERDALVSGERRPAVGPRKVAVHLAQQREEKGSFAGSRTS